MKLFVGLGNPGTKYQSTRHNLGVNVILNLFQDLQPKPKLSARIHKCTNRIYATPTTYMNESGLAVKKLVNFYKIDLKDLYIIHDDLDLPVGDYKIQFDRGPAGHNGVTSIIDQLGSQAFWRIRIGIGHPIDNVPVEDYVLMPFKPAEKKIISETIDKISTEIKNL